MINSLLQMSVNQGLQEIQSNADLWAGISTVHTVCINLHTLLSSNFKALAYVLYSIAYNLLHLHSKWLFIDLWILWI